MYGSSAMALDPLGPPVAGLTQGQFRAGLEYFYEDSEIALYNGILAGGILPPFKMNVKEHMVTANIGYGIHDRWEAFFRIGAEVSGDATGGLLGAPVQFDGRSSSVIGFGTKATFYEEGKVKFGGLFQMNWGESDGKAILMGTSANLGVDTTEIGIAVGPSYQLNEDISVYGGSLFYFMDGDVEGNILIGRLSYDIEESADLGGYVGTQILVIKNMTFHIEYLFTNSADALSMVLGCKF